MKKFILFLASAVFAFGLNFKDANQSVDELSYKSKVMIGVVDSFLKNNEPKLRELEANLTKSLSDLNSSFNAIGDELGILAFGLINAMNSQMNSSNLNTLNTDSMSKFSPKKDDIKAIINLAPNLINFAEISKNGDIFEVDIYTNEPISKESFNDLAKKTADIIRSTHDYKEKVRVYVFNDFVKFSGLY